MRFSHHYCEGLFFGGLVFFLILLDIYKSHKLSFRSQIVVSPFTSRKFLIFSSHFKRYHVNRIHFDCSYKIVKSTHHHSFAFLRPKYIQHHSCKIICPRSTRHLSSAIIHPRSTLHNSCEIIRPITNTTERNFPRRDR